MTTVHINYITKMGGCIGINRGDAETTNDSSVNVSRPVTGKWYLLVIGIYSHKCDTQYANEKKSLNRKAIN